MRSFLLFAVCSLAVVAEDSAGGPPGSRGMGDAMRGTRTSRPSCSALHSALCASSYSRAVAEVALSGVCCLPCATADPAVLEQAMKMMQNPMVMQQMKVMMQDPAVKARMKRMLQKLGENSAVPGADKFANDDEMLDSIFERMQDPETLERLQACLLYTSPSPRDS